MKPKYTEDLVDAFFPMLTEVCASLSTVECPSV